MTEKEFKKMFTINRKIDDIPREVIPTPSKEEVKRVLAPKYIKKQATEKQPIPTMILVYMLLICASVLGYIAAKYDVMKLISDALTAH